MTIKEYLDNNNYNYANDIRYRMGKVADALYYCINKVYPARVEFKNNSGYLYKVNDYSPEFLDSIMPFIITQIKAENMTTGSGGALPFDTASQ